MKIAALASLVLVLGSAACSIESSVFGDFGAGGSSGASIDLSGPDAASSSASSSASSGSGPSSASSGQPAAMCGNGVVEIGEECEDGGVTTGDGCDEACLLEGSENKCPTGATLKLASKVLLKGSTVQKKDITTTTCGGDKSPDVVYQVIPAKDGTVRVMLATPATFERVLAIRTGCSLTSGEKDISCAFDKQTLEIDVSVKANFSFHVLVSGQNGSAGTYDLTLEYK
ncbi:MAG: hypothetical protein FJ095_04590 [Deltaproteobacteria bacterium]|nr:hypothetical protein [Deltaproteobacteria bacterium]